MSKTEREVEQEIRRYLTAERNKMQDRVNAVTQSLRIEVSLAARMAETKAKQMAQSAGFKATVSGRVMTLKGKLYQIWKGSDVKVK